MEKILDILSKELMVIMVAAMPVAELRAAIPLGVSLGLHPFHAAALGLLGSMLPVPFLLIFLKPVFAYLRKNQYWRRFVDWVTNRTMKKSEKIKKYSAIGLLLFVAVPIPSTGVWTGSLAACLLNIPLRQAFLAILIGDAIAAFIVTVISHVAVGM